MTAPSFQPLHYAPTPQWHQRRRWRRGLMLGLLIAAGISSWQWGPSVWLKVQLLYFQHQCLGYQFPVGQVVYEQDQAKARALIGQPGYFNAPAPCAPVLATYVPRCWAEVTQRSRISASGAIAFLHERKAKSGQRRLVVVHFGDTGFSMPENYVLLVQPASLFSQSAPHAPAMHLDIDLKAARSIPTDGTAETRIYAGQPDAQDDSHFTIAYETEGFPGVIDGWLEGDGDRVRLAIRSGSSDIKSFTTRRGGLDIDFTRQTITGSIRSDGDFRGTIRIDGRPEEPRYRLQPDADVNEMNVSPLTPNSDTQPAQPTALPTADGLPPLTPE